MVAFSAVEAIGLTVAIGWYRKLFAPPNEAELYSPSRSEDPRAKV